MTTAEIVRAQLVAIRAQADAALALLEPADAPAAPAGPCAHPPAKRKACPVGGDPDQYLCTACHVLVSGRPAEATP